MTDVARDIAGISALDDPTRWDLYAFVGAQPSPVSREQAAAELGIPVHQAKFHLDRLEDAGLLESEYVRLTGRSGPGAGRPSKVYYRPDREISVSLPHRAYALAGNLMAAAIDEASSTNVPVAETLEQVARRWGAEIEVASTPHLDALQVAAESLREYGFEPRIADTVIELANCPFHALAAAHPRLVCSMNKALLDGACEQIGGVRASLEPGEGRCCVVLRADAS